ncbi:MAG: COG4315 family predicted lipoprotein [Solirubrobacteraceae bacterium]
MHKTFMILFTALALPLSGVASAQPPAGVAASGAITVRHTRLGSILVAPNGFTLYQFSRDRPRTDNCQKIEGCSSVWPALLASGSPKAGKGVNARLLGTIKLQDGKHQITYGGHPLYRYSGDTAPAQTDYVGANLSGGTWSAINARAGAVR